MRLCRITNDSPTPFEDCGGVQGDYDLQEKLSSPADPEYARLKAWTEQHAHVRV